MFEEAFRAWELKIGKKIGLFNTANRKIIPAEYDKIEPVVNFSQIIGFLVHKGDKVGFYNRDFSFQIPCVYNGIVIESKGDSGFEIALLKENKMAFVYTYIIDKDLNALSDKSVWYYNVKLIKICNQIEPIHIADFSETFMINNLIGIRGDLNDVYVKPNLMHLYMIDADVYYVFKDGFTYLQYIGSDDLILKSDWETEFN